VIVGGRVGADITAALKLKEANKMPIETCTLWEGQDTKSIIWSEVTNNCKSSNGRGEKKVNVGKHLAKKLPKRKNHRNGGVIALEQRRTHVGGLSQKRKIKGEFKSIY